MLRSVTYDDRISIPTPEGVDLELVLAGLGSRLVATLVDLAVRGGLGLALAFLAGGVASALGDDAGGGFVLAGGVIAGFAVLFGYDVLFETMASGRTPGKRVAGLRVVRTGGEPVGFTASAVRNLLRLVDGLPGMYAVGALSILATSRNQRLGDVAAGTLVVRERRIWSPATPLLPPAGWAPAGWARPGPAGAAGYYATWDVSAVTSHELVTVRRFLERRWQLDPAARGRLGFELAQRLGPKVAGVPTGLHPEQFLEGLAVAKAQRG